MKQEIIESISIRHVGRLLEEAELKPHQSRYWLTPLLMKNLTQKLKILLIYTSVRLNVIKTESGQYRLMK
ncbi:MAG: hypothetical protein ACR9NN_23275 [Nostochopsis sp.]